jgi:hypothetical protein
MLAIAVAASVTDLRDHRIPNRLLTRGAVAAVAVHGLDAGVSLAIAWLAAAPLPWPELVDCALAIALNTGLGAVVSVALYAARLWSAGDAKLAIVLALAQPAWVATSGPVPWAPVLVLIANGVFVALIFLAFEILVRGVPVAVRQVKRRVAERRWPVSWTDVMTTARIGLGVVAVATSLGPLRQWLGGRVEHVLAGGPFFVFLLLFLLYKPLVRVTRTGAGLAAAAVLLAAGTGWSVWDRGTNGLRGVATSFAITAAVMLGRGLLAASSRSFDTRCVVPAELAPGMVLADAQVDRLERDTRFQEAFLPVLGDLRGRRLDRNYLDNLVEWHAHNAPDETFTIRSALPFAPALALAVPLTAALGRLIFVW